uniref:ABC transporter permease n=1 Tax=Panagrellus redivivus TaxID=6233 RepID=A0A7E4V100_PANRE
MKTTPRKPIQQKKLADKPASKESEWSFYHAHAAWFFATFAGLMGFCSIYSKNVNGMTFLLVFVYFNGIHVAKSCLSYNKTMILTMMCHVPIAVAVICVDLQFNDYIMGIFQYIMFLCYPSFLIVRSCLGLRLAELRKRLLADKKLKELIGHETMFTKDSAVCLGSANAAVFLGVICYCGAVWPVGKVPLNPREIFSKIYVSLIIVGLVLVTLYFAARTINHFLKIRSLKVSTKKDKEAEALV